MRREVSTNLREVEFCLLALEDAAVAAARTKGQRCDGSDGGIPRSEKRKVTGREKHSKYDVSLCCGGICLRKYRLDRRRGYTSQRGRFETTRRRKKERQPCGTRNEENQNDGEREGRRRRLKKKLRVKVSKKRERRQGLARRGVTLGSGNPGLPISSLLLIHSNCICSQIYILFSGFPPSIRSSARRRLDTRVYRVRVSVAKRAHVHTDACARV